jgi:CRISPR/Cas system-associated protein Cas7 (RAMP superfamily)
MQYERAPNVINNPLPLATYTIDEYVNISYERKRTNKKRFNIYLQDYCIIQPNNIAT